MSARASLGLITIGAILALAVRAEPGFLDLHVTGLILIAVGLIRPLVAGWASLGPRVARRGPRSEPTTVVEEVVAAEPPVAERLDGHRTATARPPQAARHGGRSTSRA